MNLNLNLSDASARSSHVSSCGPCCEPGPPGESQMKRSQFLLMNGVTSCKMNKMGVQIREEFKGCKRGTKCSWGSEVREIHKPVGVIQGRYHGVVAFEMDITN